MTNQVGEKVHGRERVRSPISQNVNGCHSDWSPKGVQVKEILSPFPTFLPLLEN